MASWFLHILPARNSWVCSHSASQSRKWSTTRAWTSLLVRSTTCRCRGGCGHAESRAYAIWPYQSSPGLDFSPDARWIVSVALDGTLRTWGLAHRWVHRRHTPPQRRHQRQILPNRRFSRHYPCFRQWYPALDQPRSIPPVSTRTSRITNFLRCPCPAPLPMVAHP